MAPQTDPLGVKNNAKKYACENDDFLMTTTTFEENYDLLTNISSTRVYIQQNPVNSCVHLAKSRQIVSTFNKQSPKN